MILKWILHLTGHRAGVVLVYPFYAMGEYWPVLVPAPNVPLFLIGMDIP
jgi:hypothetical protein